MRTRTAGHSTVAADTLAASYGTQNFLLLSFWSCRLLKFHVFLFFLSGSSSDPQHQQEGERGAEDDLRHVGQGLGEARRAQGPQGMEQRARGTLAFLGNQGVLARGTKFNSIRAAIPGRRGWFLFIFVLCVSLLEASERV